MYWMSRYIERAENTARFLDVNFHLLLDLNKISAVDSQDYWESLILVTSDKERFDQYYSQTNADTVTDFLVFNRNNPSSISSCIAFARENGRSIIETISSEMWEQINNTYHFVQGVNARAIKADPYDFYKEIKNASHLFQGITDSTLSHNDGWDFMQAGKALERADNTARLIGVKYHLLQPKVGSDNLPIPTPDSVDIIQWMAVLKSCSALEAFRKVHLSNIDPHTILAFLVLDRVFPRSLYFSVSYMQRALWRISGSSHRRYNNNADRLVGKLDSELSYTSIDDIYEQGLDNYLENLQQRLARIGEQIYEIYFAYHIPEMQFPQQADLAMWFNGVNGGLAQWSQAEQQQQQQQQ
jgi:uncharacterized alpha-E superfamily protein